MFIKRSVPQEPVPALRGKPPIYEFAKWVFSATLQIHRRRSGDADAVTALGPEKDASCARVTVAVSTYSRKCMTLPPFNVHTCAPSDADSLPVDLTCITKRPSTTTLLPCAMNCSALARTHV
jgi:hypothetical protein